MMVSSEYLTIVMMIVDDSTGISLSPRPSLYRTTAMQFYILKDKIV